METNEDSSKLRQWLAELWSAISTIWRAIVSKTPDRPAEPKDKLKVESELYDFSSHGDQSHQQAGPPKVVTAPGTIPIRTSAPPLSASKDPAIREMTLPVEDQTSPYQVAESTNVEQNASHKDPHRESPEIPDIPSLVTPKGLRVEPEVLVGSPSIIGPEPFGNRDMAHAVDVIDDSQTNGTLADRVNESVRESKSLPQRKTGKSTASQNGEMDTRIAPIERGGRPRGQRELTEADGPISTDRSQKLRPQRPELVCWLQGMAWVLGIEMPEGCQESIQAHQGTDLILEEDDTKYVCLRLKKPFEAVEFVGDEKEPVDDKSWQIPENRFRLFKLAGAQGTRGRAVRQCTSGRFLVVVPDSWSWSQDLVGAANGASEFVSTGECRAYHFDLPLERGKMLSFKTPEGETVPIPCTTEHFQLTGNRIVDAHMEAGPLFGIEPPQLSLLDPSSQERKVNTVVVGEEGSSGRKGTWRAQAESFEDLRPEIMRRGAGWFFVRLYDDNNDLIESLDFRFAAGLKALNVEKASALPGTGGHSEARIVFRHSGDYAIRSLSSGSLGPVAFSEGSIAHVPPDPECDDSKWIVGAEAGFNIDVTVLVERIWWAIAHDPIETRGLKWTSLPFSLSRDDFRATSPTVIHFRQPRPGWAEEVRIGFEADRSRPVHLSRSERNFLIPLRELGSARELQESTPASLKVWVTPADSMAERFESVVGSISSAARPAERITEQYFLRIQGIPPHKLMGALSELRKCARGPIRRIISELRRECYPATRAWCCSSTREEFVCDGLCVFALVIEHPETLIRRHKIRERWLRRAEVAATRFPERMAVVRSRYAKLSGALGSTTFREMPCSAGID
jgi:hypothetical protein